MAFNSTTFIFFLVGVYFVYWAIAHHDRTRIWFLLVASCAFYMSWNAKFILLVLFTAVVDYFVARTLGRTRNPTARRALLVVTLTSNLSVLGFFKYANFFAETAHSIGDKIAGASTPFTAWNIILQIGRAHV